MAVAGLYFYLAPTIEYAKVGKAMIRLALHAPKEIQYVILANLTSIAATRFVCFVGCFGFIIIIIIYYFCSVCLLLHNRPAMLEPSLNDFFIKPSDAIFCRNLKLEILTHLVNAENINRILKEFRVSHFFFPRFYDIYLFVVIISIIVIIVMIIIFIITIFFCSFFLLNRLMFNTKMQVLSLLQFKR
jgi:hypothetical protein